MLSRVRRFAFWMCLLSPGMACAQVEAGPGDLLNLEQARTFMVSLINRDRLTHGLAPVALDMTASLAAQSHTDEMVEYGYSSHWGLDGKKPDQRYTEGGGADADAENGHFEYSQRNSSNDPQFQDDKAPRQLPLVANPKFSRKTLEDIEAEFFHERPPSDGHRKNILEANHNRVGISLSAASEGGLNRIACTQEFVDHYGGFTAIPQNLRRGDGFDVKGVLLPGWHVYAVLLRFEELPKPMTIAELAQTGSYGPSFAEPTASYFPEVESAPIAVTQNADGEAIAVHVATQATWKSGLYYLEIWARKPGAADPVALSRRTLVISDAATSEVGVAAQATAYQWTPWLVDNDTSGVPTPVRSRKGCATAANADGSHLWAVQFRNEDPANAYRVIFQLVPRDMASPPNWPASAVTVTIGASGTFTSPSNSAFSISGDCTSAPHLYYTVNPAGAPSAP